MKHDAKVGWCCCGQYHVRKNNRPRKRSIVDREMKVILGRKEFTVNPVIKHRGGTL